MFMSSRLCHDGIAILTILRLQSISSSTISSRHSSRQPLPWSIFSPKVCCRKSNFFVGITMVVIVFRVAFWGSKKSFLSLIGVWSGSFSQRTSRTNTGLVKVTCIVGLEISFMFWWYFRAVRASFLSRSGFL